MNPQALAIYGIIQSGFAVAPDVIRFAAVVKQFVDDMFTNSVISAADQNELHRRVTLICTAHLRGETPPHWQVEPDPGS